MARGRGSSIWGPELVPPIHGPAKTIPVTVALIRRWNRLVQEWRRFRMPTQKEEQRLDTLTHEHAIRAATVSHGAYLGRARVGLE